jgi:hypothetical protein
MTTFEFFLGGDDAEMREIKEITKAAGCVVHDKKLSWGAKASSYGTELKNIYRHNRKYNAETWMCNDTMKAAAKHTSIIGVCVEIEKDIDFGKWAHNANQHTNYMMDFYHVDHHGSRSGEIPAIIQVCNLLRVKPTRKQCLIGAMDAGYVYGLEAIGSTKAEVKNFLGGSNAAKTVRDILVAGLPASRAAEIREAEEAVKKAEHLDNMVIVRLPHNWTAPVTAMLHGEDKQNLLILSEWTDDNGKINREANYYATGEKIAVVNDMIPGGWTGGAGLLPPTKKAKEFWTQFGGYVPNTAFWGCSNAHHGTVLKAVMSIN